MNGGDHVVSLEKLKKIKGLSAVNTTTTTNNNNKGSCSYEVEKEKKCEMGGGGEVSDKEEVQAPSAIIGVASTNNKRFRLPRKVSPSIMS